MINFHAEKRHFWKFYRKLFVKLTGFIDNEPVNTGFNDHVIFHFNELLFECWRVQKFSSEISKFQIFLLKFSKFPRWFELEGRSHSKHQKLAIAWFWIILNFLNDFEYL